VLGHDLLDQLTEHPAPQPILPDLKASLVVRDRIAYSEASFAEVVVRVVAAPLAGSVHTYKYRLAFIAHGECVLRYDNETGKGDHRHATGTEARYRFSTLSKLFADFERNIRRYLDEDRDP
jgi:hypothetical protein